MQLGTSLLNTEYLLYQIYHLVSAKNLYCYLSFCYGTTFSDAVFGQLYIFIFFAIKCFTCDYLNEHKKFSDFPFFINFIYCL